MSDNRDKLRKIGSFVFGDDRPDEMTLEDVIMKYHKVEMSRSDRDEDLLERIVTVSYHSTIQGLETSMERVASDYGIAGIGMMTFQRCAAHMIESWYDNMPELKEIGSLYGTLLRQADDFGFADIGRSIQQTTEFEFLNAVATKAKCRTTSFSTIGKFKTALVERSRITGIDVYKLFAIGMAFAISRNTSEWSAGTIRQFLSPEVEHLRDYLIERLWHLQYYEKVIQHRLLRKGVTVTTEQ